MAASADSPARSFAQVGASDLAAIKGDCARKVSPKPTGWP